MAARMRLARGGRKHAPFYNIVVADSRSPRDGKFIEKIGIYNPLARGQDPVFKLDEDRAAAWFGHGALATDGLARLMVKHGVGPQAIRDDFSKRRDGRIAVKQKEADAKAAAEAAAKAKEEAEAAAAAQAEEAEAAAEAETPETAEADDTSKAS